MKAKILKPFKDKHTQVRYKEGEIITISRERFAEILTKGPLVEEVKSRKGSKTSE